MKDAYMAGLFDGEGCVSVIRRKAKKGCVADGFSLDVRIGMTCLRTLQAIAQAYGGSISPLKRSNPKYRQAWHWYCTGDTAMAVLTRIRPFAITKAEQIRLAIAFQQQCHGSYRHSKAPPSERFTRGYGFHMKMKDMKRPSVTVA